jgi:quercetin dioxygenase-like cupin family protein
MTKFTALLIAAAVVAGPAFAQAPKPQSMVDKEQPTNKPVAVVDLGKEFEALKGYNMQQTINVVQPGWGKAAHSHLDAPEIVYVISGTLTDQRIPGQPVKYGPGSTILNTDKISHMWANLGTEPVVMVNTSVRVSPAAK